MKIRTITISSLLMAGLISTLQVNASTQSCSAGLTTHTAQFESAIEYDDKQSKVNPTVHVLVNGKIAKMMLDTGANKNLLWDLSLLDEAPGPRSQSVDSHVASAEARSVEATLGDGRGNAQRKEFYVLDNSVLAADGYSGILSPQAVAGQNAVIIDFEKNCFFTTTPFDIDSVKGAQIRRGAAIQNPYDVMAIHVELDGRDIPLLVDSGASRTTILASLVTSKPKGPASPRMKDLFGAELPKAEPMRLVDLKVVGQAFMAHPVIPAPTTSDKGIENSGYIGMDILKDRVIYYDGVRREFNFLTRKPIAKYTGIEPETRAE
ncbi:hypothetical protein CAL14_10930 [Bordetella genomosp. 9]|uniref:aspartyl protease family protein n=1 Tax=Bordetella genomosp. 9 TaxID=1416803 RepID=UPI000A2916DD|nr:aspartyl protease family protein [Bordetella genomosp. 9]ARP90742.1 hypothetical protein CAL14_10930 [Bordetella genomosp. 9]